MNKVVSAKLSDELDGLFEEKRKKSSLSRSDFLRSIVCNELRNNDDPIVLKNTEHKINHQNQKSVIIESEELYTRLMILEKKVELLSTNANLKGRQLVIYFSEGMLLIGIGLYVISKSRLSVFPSF